MRHNTNYLPNEKLLHARRQLAVITCGNNATITIIVYIFYDPIEYHFNALSRRSLFINKKEWPFADTELYLSEIVVVMKANIVLLSWRKSALTLAGGIQ